MIIPGICTQCGATLSVDNERDAMVCPYCNTPFIIEKAIQNFTNVYNITQNIYVQGNLETGFEIVSGVLTKYKGKSANVKIPQGVKKITASALVELQLRLWKCVMMLEKLILVHLIIARN